MYKVCLRGFLAAVLLTSVAAGLPGVSGEPAVDGRTLSGYSGGLTVMTRNIYVGADVDIVLAAVDPSQVPVLAAEAFEQMISTDFPERADALAGEISIIRPQLIGLQEVSLIRFQESGDAVMGGTEPAEEVLYNYLRILLRALEERRLDYRVAVKVQNADVEIPMVNPDSPIGFSDVRLTDFDVILAREDVVISRKAKGHYQARLVVPGAGIEVPRGWCAVDAEFKGRSYRFVNTHLEPASVPELVPLQMAQAQELLMLMASAELPVILVGDLNSPAPEGETYRFIKSQGFVDAWMRNLMWGFSRFNRKGFTSLNDPDLRNSDFKLFERIDLIMVRKNMGDLREIGPVVAFVTGDEPEDRTPSGLWPSDHAGVAAKLWIPMY